MIQSVLLESNTPTIKSEYMYGGDTIGLPAWCNGFFNGELCMGNCEMICLYGVIEGKWRMVCIVWMHGVNVFKWVIFYIVCVWREGVGNDSLWY
jgi:hypothetical protein